MPVRAQSGQGMLREGSANNCPANGAALTQAHGLLTAGPSPHPQGMRHGPAAPTGSLALELVTGPAMEAPGIVPARLSSRRSRLSSPANG
jgi:hypothetical protein